MCTPHTHTLSRLVFPRLQTPQVVRDDTQKQLISVSLDGPTLPPPVRQALNNQVVLEFSQDKCATGIMLAGGLSDLTISSGGDIHWQSLICSIDVTTLSWWRQKSFSVCVSQHHPSENTRSYCHDSPIHLGLRSVPLAPLTHLVHFSAAESMAPLPSHEELRSSDLFSRGIRG